MSYRFKFVVPEDVVTELKSEFTRKVNEHLPKLAMNEVKEEEYYITSKDKKIKCLLESSKDDFFTSGRVCCAYFFSSIQPSIRSDDYLYYIFFHYVVENKEIGLTFNFKTRVNETFCFVNEGLKSPYTFDFNIPDEIIADYYNYFEKLKSEKLSTLDGEEEFTRNIKSKYHTKVYNVLSKDNIYPDGRFFFCIFEFYNHNEEYRCEVQLRQDFNKDERPTIKFRVSKKVDEGFTT